MKFARPTAHYLIAILAIAILLRFPLLGAKSLWLDEAASVYHATPGLDNVDPIHPPLYYVIVYYAMAHLGRTEVAIRLPSALFSLANVGLLYLIGRRLFNREVGLLAAALLALSPLDIWYAQEARMYAAIGSATLLMALGLVQRHRTGFLIYFAGLAAGLHLIYFFPLVWLALSAIWLAYWRREDGSVMPLLLWLGATAAAWWLFRPWLNPLWRWSTETLGGHWTLAPMRSALGVTELAPLHFGIVAIMGIAGIFIVAWFAPAALRRRRWRRLITILAVAAFVIILVLVPIPRIYAVKRMLTLGLPLALLAAAWLLLRWENGRQRLIGVLLALSLASSLVSVLLVPKDDWRGVARTLQTRAPQAAVWVDPRWNRIVYDYYRPQQGALHGDLEALERVAQEQETLWLVAERFHGRPVPSSPSEVWLDEHLRLMETIPFYRLELRRYERAP